jgi:hypothetical protein
MPLRLSTAIEWTSLEDALERIENRNRKKRIIFDTLYIKVGGSDPLRCWDAENLNFVYVQRSDWIAASPTIATLEACVILRVSPTTVRRHRDALGIKMKRGVPGKFEGVPKQAPQAYYSLQDIIEIARSIADNTKLDVASENEIRKLFARGYTTYKVNRFGEFVPTWSETI